MRRIHQLGYMLLALVLLLGGCGAPLVSPLSTSSPTVIPTAALSVTPTPAEFAHKVDVGGYNLYIHCAGTGSPTVVLDSGLEDDSHKWANVFSKVQLFTRVCVYDRASLGNSDPGPKPRTSNDMVKDLHALLTNATINRPYVLVGHSVAGFTVRLYANQYPQEVVGMVLVDVTHPDQFAGWQAVMPPPSPQDSDDVRGFRVFLSTYIHDPTQNREGLDIAASAAQVRATGMFGAMPLVILTHGLARGADPDAWSPGLPDDLVAKLESVHLDLQNDLARLSSNSSHVIADHSFHCIQCYQPDLVINAIQKVVDAARGK